MTGMRTPEEIAKEIYNVHTLVYLSYEERLQKTIYLLRQYAEQENSLRESSSPVESDEIKRLRDALNKDKTGLAEGLANVVRIVDSYHWVTEGRGPYAWNDDQYRKEMLYMLENIEKAARKALHESGQLVKEAFNPSTKPTTESEAIKEERRLKMRDDANSIFELIKGFTNETNDNAMKSAIEMAGYVLELTN